MLSHQTNSPIRSRTGVCDAAVGIAHPVWVRQIVVLDIELGVFTVLINNITHIMWKSFLAATRSIAIE